MVTSKLYTIHNPPPAGSPTYMQTYLRKFLASIDESDKTANIIVDVIGLVGIGTFAIGGLAALVGIITFATALGALEIVGALAAAAGLVLVVLSIYEGAVQREASFEMITQPLTHL